MARVRLGTHIIRSASWRWDALRHRSMKAFLLAVLCLASAVCIRAQGSQSSGDESWTKTSESADPNIAPSRTTDIHSKSGNKTVDKQRFDVLGPNGRFQPFSETETETVQLSDSSTRTIVRTYQWDANGRRTLTKMTEEDSHTTPAGETRVERKTSSADVNGNFQVIRREVADTKKLSSGMEETKTSVYKRDSYGDLSPSEQTQELKTRGTDDTVAIKKTTQITDGNGSWKVSGVTETTIKGEGQNRTTDERVSTSDINGNLKENSRTISKDSENTAGEKRSVIETYDGAQLRQRVTTVQKKRADGESTEQQVEEPSLGNPSDGAKVTGRTKYVVKYASPNSKQPATQKTTTSETRDANGKLHVFSVETQKSTQPAPDATPPPPPKADAPPPKANPPPPKDKP